MPSIDHITLSYMRDELVKTAFLGAVGRALMSSAGRALENKAIQAGGRYVAEHAMDSAAMAGAGGLAGGVGGAALGAYEGSKKDGVGGAIEGALKRGYQGALGGAALGGAAGMAGAGRLGGGKVLNAVTKGENPLAVAGRFGQRQLHSVTGMAPGGAARGTEEYANALKGMRVHGWDAAGKADKAKAALEQATSEGASARKLKGLTKDVERTQAAADSSQEVLSKGLTSIPGMASEIAAKKSLSPIWTHGIKPQATQRGVFGKAMLALPVAAAAPELAVSQDEEGRGRAERFSKAIAEGAAYTATPLLPMVGSSLVASGAGGAGGLAGKGIDKLIGALSGPKKNEIGDTAGTVPPADGDAQGGVPVERVMSNAALGKPPEDMMV